MNGKVDGWHVYLVDPTLVAMVPLLHSMRLYNSFYYSYAQLLLKNFQPSGSQRWNSTLTTKEGWHSWSTQTVIFIGMAFAHLVWQYMPQCHQGNSKCSKSVAGHHMLDLVEPQWRHSNKTLTTLPHTKHALYTFPSVSHLLTNWATLHMSIKLMK